MFSSPSETIFPVSILMNELILLSSVDELSFNEFPSSSFAPFTHIPPKYDI